MPDHQEFPQTCSVGIIYDFKYDSTKEEECIKYINEVEKKYVSNSKVLIIAVSSRQKELMKAMKKLKWKHSTWLSVPKHYSKCSMRFYYKVANRDKEEVK